jgi:hypothetical protein
MKIQKDSQLFKLNKKNRCNVNKIYTFANTLRGGAVVARRAHNPKVIGSSPIPATKKSRHFAGFFILKHLQACMQ